MKVFQALVLAITAALVCSPLSLTASAESSAWVLAPRKPSDAARVGSSLLAPQTGRLAITLDGFEVRGFEVILRGSVRAPDGDLPFSASERFDDDGRPEVATFEIPLFEDREEPCSTLHAEKLELRVRLSGVSRVRVIRGQLSVLSAPDYCSDENRTEKSISLFP